MERGGAIYFMSNKTNTTIYTGVTSNLLGRVFEHKIKKYPQSFTAKYNCIKLVYFEGFNSIEEAIAREKQIKAGSRKKKNQLVESINPKWEDLFEKLKKES